VPRGLDFSGQWTVEGVLRILCCREDEWVVTDCLSKKTVKSFAKIGVTYNVFEKRPDGSKGARLPDYKYELDGMNDGNIWARKSLSDEEAASTFLHECEHDRVTPPPGSREPEQDEEIEVRIREEQWRIRKELPPSMPRKKDAAGKDVPDDQKIRDYVEDEYRHRSRTSNKIYENRREDITPPPNGTVEAGWDCSRIRGGGGGAAPGARP